MVIGEDEIINKAQIARNKTNQAQENEENDINNLEDDIEKYGMTSRYNNGNPYDVLWNWETKDSDGNMTKNVTNSGSITLNNNIENYKYLIIFAKGYLSGEWQNQVSTVVPSKVTTYNSEYAVTFYQWSNAGYTISFGFLNSNTLDINYYGAYWWTNCTITEVWGIK